MENMQKLQELATLLGVQTSYKSAFGHEQEISPEALTAVINALGVVSLKADGSDVTKAIAKIAQGSHSLSEPVVVFWEGKPARIPVYFAGSPKGVKVEAAFKLESGEPFTVKKDLSSLAVAGERTGVTERWLLIDRKIPFGYHHIQLTAGGKKQKILVISSPWKAYEAPASSSRRSLSVFAPLYALHSERSWGIGDFSELAALVDWAYGHGADIVGTLPLLAIFNGKPAVEPSPYSPMSRLHWNEMHVDPRRSIEWEECPKARKLAESADFKKKVKKLQALKAVDYEEVAKLKRKVMEILAEYFFAEHRERSPEYKEFLKLYPTVEDFAEFRAVGEKRNAPWRKWPDRLRGGKVQPGDYNAKDKRYHLYTQYLAHQQLSALALVSKSRGRGIYIDFPLSAHADGYDVWRERESFGQTASAGCPADPAHVHGQDWGILPLNPQSIRRNGYRYFRRCLESHMRYAGLLRLDHVMCFYRLYWVPHGLGAKNGAYVRYNLDEFFALLVLESHRNRCTLIGEDLGTVPPEIREAMTEHGILRMCVQQRKLAPKSEDPFGEVPENAICSLNTHDMPPFAAFWKGLDIVDKLDLGYFPRKELPAKKAAREEQKKALCGFLHAKGLLASADHKAVKLKDVLKATLLLTAKDPVSIMQVNLEDLWLETQFQNVPGTWKERPNWRQKCRYGMDELGKLNKELGPVFDEILRLRK